MKIALLNGPNLNLLGKRETGVYGKFTLDDVSKELKDILVKHSLKKVEIIEYQSNIEGELINFIHKADENEIKHIIFNPGAYTHTSIAIRDAIAGIKAEVIEVHISNVYKREEFRHKSMIAPVCKGQILGFGLDSYVLALLYIVNNMNESNKIGFC